MVIKQISAKKTMSLAKFQRLIFQARRNPRGAKQRNRQNFGKDKHIPRNDDF